MLYAFVLPDTDWILRDTVTLAVAVAISVLLDNLTDTITQALPGTRHLTGGLTDAARGSDQLWGKVISTG
jgi:hypothetical protein